MKSLKPIGLLLVVMIILAAFGAYAEWSGLLKNDSPTPASGTQTPLPIAEVAEAAATDLPATLPPTPPAEESCLTCHTDQEALQAMAQEEEAAESLSSGEG